MKSADAYRTKVAMERLKRQVKLNGRACASPEQVTAIEKTNTGLSEKHSPMIQSFFKG